MLGGVISQRVRFFHDYWRWRRGGPRPGVHHTTTRGQFALGFVNTHPALSLSDSQAISENIMSVRLLYTGRGRAADRPVVSLIKFLADPDGRRAGAGWQPWHAQNMKHRAQLKHRLIRDMKHRLSTLAIIPPSYFIIKLARNYF